MNESDQTYAIGHTGGVARTGTVIGVNFDPIVEATGGANLRARPGETVWQGGPLVFYARLMARITDLPIVRKSRAVLPGLLIAVVVAMAAMLVAERFGVPVMLAALAIGMVFNFLATDGEYCAPGIEFAAKSVLRAGIALLGLGITVGQIAATGQEVLLITFLGVGVTIALGLGLSRFVGRNTHFGLLTGGAVAICGASAALAISSVLPKSEKSERDTIVTVIMVTALSTVAMIVYPMIAEMLNLSEMETGLFLGATIHDVAQVVSAGYSVSDPVGETATFVKLLRVVILVPVIVVLALVFADAQEPGQKRKLPIPFFVLGFSALVIVGSFNIVPDAIKDMLLDFSRWCLVIAIAALGMKTSLKKLSGAGGSALFVICALTVLLAGFSLMAIKSNWI